MTDRKLYYRLIGHDGIARRTTDPLGWYEALLYWKLYSQPAATSNLGKWMAPGSASRRSAESFLPLLLASHPKTLARSADDVVDAVKDLSNFGLPGMSTKCAIPVRSTFLHFLYPTIVPIFDKMVLKAVGVNDKDANHDYNVLREYLPHAWKLADRYAARATVQCKHEQPIRLIDMALWVNRGKPGADGVAPRTSQSTVRPVPAGRPSGTRAANSNHWGN
ncbi:MAG TPA: hypothetical protein VGN42_16220 [Pirellulales bacterium]|nr:hypothetical protein [Pirellulales bacterium]